MGWVTGVVTFIKLIAKLIDLWSERDKERKKKKEEAISEVREGIKKRDPSRITSGFDRFNRI